DSHNTGHPKSRITNLTFSQRVHDLLGVRVIVMRLGDLDRLRDYIDGLNAEGRLRILGKPKDMRTFLIRPGRGDYEKADMQYSGYSSVHYRIRLGPALRMRDVASVKAELQLRTVFEEAWGEIDHKYRYELKRSGIAIPRAVDDGFRDLALYLQAATR